ncbi:TadE/TadG family type IV pilus assembly protein [Erythrobacter rubeus]|uniref:Pilus assembly protein n=1 Tax=Erythrobacter rubeus TaxID=2760803 RepID=A0ABR8KQR9_9SPHN|nr:TadE/TadG family type IV pilus assembly protein [Erythrobacter rubeus]MBD2841747.1 pilus assembly protein [Erythrobacter rubeus]
MKKRSERASVRELKNETEGVVLIEFALILPLLITLIFGCLELANYALSHLRVSQIALTVADNAGRVQTSIDEVDIYEVFEGARTVGDPIDFAANGRLVLSSLQNNEQTGSDAGQMINWQRCMGQLDVDPAYGEEGDGRNNDDLEDGLGPAGNKIVAADGTAVMFVEVTYTYQPLINLGFINNASEIRYESAFNVRERANQDITNTQSLTTNDCD